MHRRMTVLFLFAVLCVGRVWAQDSRPSGDPLAEEAVTKTIRFIASDEMAGRDTPSSGLDRAADWLAAELKAVGLEGGGKDGSFFHEWTLTGTRVDSAAVKVSVKSADGKSVELKPKDDVRVWFGANGFNGEDTPVLRAKLGDKQLTGRIGAQYPVLIEIPKTSPIWAVADGQRVGPAGRGASQPFLLVREGVLPEGDLTATIDVPKSEKVSVTVRNVVAMIRGSEKPDEFVLYSAHYDHIGISLGSATDVIFNGADDDGTGTTAVCQIAKAFALAKERPKRSVMFAFFSGEEKGLKGSQAFAETPPVPLEKIVVNLNLEMLGRPPAENRKKLWITGREYSDFEKILAEGLDGTGVGLWTFEMQGQLFRQSDNYSLARKGVIAHSISSSSLHEDYHGLKDEADRIDTEHLATVIGAIYRAGRHFADRPNLPAWSDKAPREVRGAK